ncbi:MAG: rhodanese-like domain-containing protein [Gammaproteobacteria bacterium]|nr:rhodanese-like domain-containing protein [Gammaproteobacteria bacterium]
MTSVDAVAENNKTPEYIDDVTLVGAEGMIELIERINNLVIVDSRIPGDRFKGYIESSVSLPDTETTCKSLSKILKQKQTPALFYCNGVKCGRSAVALNIAKKCGYKELYWFRGGFEIWLKKGFPYILD